MKSKMLMAVAALMISAGITAQEPTRTQTQTQSGERTQVQTQTDRQNRSGATIQTQTQGQYQNYGQMTKEQKQARNAERKALKKQQKEAKKLQKQLKKQEAVKQGNANMYQEKAAIKNKGARRATPQQRAVKASRGAGAGKR